jgi:hypothetical protein
MRKIETKEEIEKSRKKRNLIIGIILVVIMAMSTIGYSFLNNKEIDETKKIKYNGIELYSSQGFWAVVLNGKTLYFQNLPAEVENISIKGFFELKSYSNKPLYFVNYNPAAGEIVQNLNSYILRYQEACLNSTENIENEKCKDLPLKDCSENNIIVYDLNESETKVKQNAGCVYISGDMAKSGDAFLYRLFGIIK